MLYYRFFPSLGFRKVKAGSSRLRCNNFGVPRKRFYQRADRFRALDLKKGSFKLKKKRERACFRSRTRTLRFSSKKMQQGNEITDTDKYTNES